MKIDFKDKHVVLTGGSNGIGAEMVRAFRRAGATIYFCGRKKNAATGLIEELGGGDRLHFSVVNLEEPAAIEA